jgi:hypothetical protein
LAQSKKFHTTLPRKIDIAVEEYLAAIESAEQSEWEFWEKSTTPKRDNS